MSTWPSFVIAAIVGLEAGLVADSPGPVEIGALAYVVCLFMFTLAVMLKRSGR